MSSATRSKSKDRKAAKGFSKASGHTNSAASGYNPVSGTFHAFETSPVPSANIDSRFRSIDDTDDYVGNLSASGTVEYDSVSNAGSWSGGSEDHKEKPSQPTPRQQESVSRADNDKREKMRLKNEKKHQRKKERRAQELHDRCNGYLMSRKLESLAQQLVAMGFSQERATMALILNEGNIEESVVCLVEAEGKLLENDGGGELKIDITEELARVMEMVVRYKTTKQDVERTVVSCEGDLDKVEEILKAQNEPKPEEILDPPTLTNGKAPFTLSQNPLRVQEKPVSTITQQGRDEKDFNYTKTQVPVGSSVDKVAKSMQLLKRLPPPPESEWPKQQKEKMWPNAGYSQPVSASFASPSQALPPQLKQEPRYAPVTNELKNLQLGSVKEPVIVMQRPQSVNTVKQAPTTTNVSSFPPRAAMAWYPNSMDPPKPSGFVQQSPAITGTVSSNTVNSSNSFKQTPYPSHLQFMQPNISNSMDSQGAVSVNNGGLWTRGGTSPALAPASSLGLFSGTHTSNGLQVSRSQIDWSTGISKQFDYTNIDWSVGRGSWSGTSYSMTQNNARTYEPLNYGMGVKSNNIERPVVANGNSAPMTGLQTGDSVASGGGSQEWTSPFEERDIFGLSRQFVSSPSL